MRASDLYRSEFRCLRHFKANVLRGLRVHGIHPQSPMKTLGGLSAGIIPWHHESKGGALCGLSREPVRSASCREWDLFLPWTFNIQSDPWPRVHHRGSEAPKSPKAS